MNYTARAGKLYAGDAEIQLRGISHHGFNGSLLLPQLLWIQGWKEQLADIQRLGFNAVRCPFVPDTLHLPKGDPTFLKQPGNEELVGKTPLQALDLWMAEADRLGLYILIDFHSVSRKSQYFHPFVTEPADYGAGKWVETWNQQPYTIASWISDLVFVAKRYKTNQHFIGIDIFNEPHDRVRWTTGGDAQWKPLVEQAAKAILAANPNLLIFAQGITANWDGKEKAVEMNWGENLQPQAYSPIQIAPGKLVLSPHTYGPDVWNKASFSAPNFPANLAAEWEVLFGQFADKIPVVLGEFGGQYEGADKVWQDALVDYLISKPTMRSSFYWCYANSGDTGAIVDGNGQVIPAKLALLQRLWTAPAPPVVVAPVSRTPAVIGAEIMARVDELVARAS